MFGEWVHSIFFKTYEKLQGYERVASGGLDQMVKLYDIESGTEINLGGHSLGIRCMEFSNRHELIVSGSWDSTIKVSTFWSPFEDIWSFLFWTFWRTPLICSCGTSAIVRGRSRPRCLTASMRWTSTTTRSSSALRTGNLGNLLGFKKTDKEWKTLEFQYLGNFHTSKLLFSRKIFLYDIRRMDNPEQVRESPLKVRHFPKNLISFTKSDILEICLICSRFTVYSSYF